MNIKIKFCGITTVLDYIVAWHLGVDYIGFIRFEQSPRAIDPHKIVDIIAAADAEVSSARFNIHHAKPRIVGVYVDTHLDQILRETEIVGFDVLQLYDHLISYEFQKSCIQLPYWKAHRISSLRDIEMLNKEYNIHFANNENKMEAIVLDTFHPSKFGGMGVAFNWELLEHLDTIIPYFIAGGIKHNNINKLLTFNPYGIDVSSGIEIAPGKKDAKLMNQLIRSIRR